MRPSLSRRTITSVILGGSTDETFLCGCATSPCLCAESVRALAAGECEGEEEGGQRVGGEGGGDGVGTAARGFFHSTEKATQLAPEVDYGPVEYKWKLVSPTKARLKHLVTQLKFRLAEGGGEAIYEVGVTDDGRPVGLDEAELDETIATLEMMAAELGADLTVLRTREGTDGLVAEVLVRKLANEEFTELRVAAVGNVDAGKSTLIGVLAHGQLDNGRGHARLNVFRHPHEVESGRTSCVAQEILGFDSKGAIVNYPSDGACGSGLVTSHDLASWSEICASAAKVVNFIDLAGHEKHLRTTLAGLTGSLPDFVMMTVAANAGLTGMARDHLSVALALSVPTFVVVTKVDMTPKRVRKASLRAVAKFIRSPGVAKIPVLVSGEDDVVVAARNLLSGRITPIFEVSSVSGAGLALLKLFLNLLPHRVDWSDFVFAPVEFAIEDTFSVPGVGTVAAGIVRAGTVCVGDELELGPDASGAFRTVVVKSIHVNRTPAKAAAAGQTASLGLKRVKRATISKGMMLVDRALAPVAHWSFTATVSHQWAWRIEPGHELVVHTGTTRSSARVDAVTPAAADGLSLSFSFLYSPAWVKPGQRIVLRDGNIKGVGAIVTVGDGDRDRGPVARPAPHPAAPPLPAARPAAPPLPAALVSPTAS